MEQKPDDVIRSFTRAAGLNYADAMYCLGPLYLNGDGVEQGLDAARERLTKAAEHNHKNAAHYLASFT